MDLRFALRSFVKQPTFCVTAILTLALGIGANTAIFSVFNGIILRPFPYRNADRVVMVWQKRPNGQMNSVAGVYYRQWIKQATVFERLAGLIPQTFNVGAGEDLAQVFGARVSANFFSTLGVQPALGRDFVPDEDQAGPPRVAIVTYSLWQTQLGGDASRLGKVVHLSGEAFTLIGILPRDFEFIIPGIEVWVPLVFQKGSELNANKMAVFGRLKAAASLEQARREMDTVAKRLETVFPDDKGWGTIVVPLRDMIGGNVRPALTALLGAVGFVLLIACANVANLLLARSDGRYREVAIRTALGAGRLRLIRQLVTETMLLAAAGSLCGLALAYGGLQLLVSVARGQLPRIEGVALDSRVLGFALVVTVLTGLLFGLFPAHQLLGGDLQSALRESGRGSNNSRRGRRSRNLLIVSEIALSLILAIGATLMLRSLLWLEGEDRGFSPAHQLTLRVSLSGPELSNIRNRAEYYQRMLDRIRALPGVRAVGATNNLPVDGYRMVGSYFHVASEQSSAEPPSAAVDMINPGYFQALGIPILAGREFDGRDREGAPAVAIISSALARQYFAGQNPIGGKLTLGSPGRGDTEISREIVGVAGDVRYLTKRPGDSVEIYLPYAQAGWPAVYVVVKSEGDPASIAPSIRAALRESSLRLPVSDVQAMEHRIQAVNGRARLDSVLATVFALIALVLAAVGIYGVSSYSVLQRTREIGIRMALGATNRDIQSWIVGQSLLLAGAGVAIGLAGQYVLSRVIRSLLYGTSPNDVFTWIGASTALALIAMVASYIPALRATRGDPMAALRSE